MGGHDFTWPYDHIGIAEYINRFRHLAPTSPFRSKVEYSNILYILAGYIEEKVSGQSWGDLVRKRIFEPLGMRYSVCSLDEMKGLPDCASSYIEMAGELRPYPINAATERPSGSICSSAADLAKWLRFNASGFICEGRALIEPELGRELHTPQVVFEINRQWGTDVTVCYGLGWFIRDYRGKKIVYHSGATQGYASLVAFAPEIDFTFAGLVNLHERGTFILNSYLYSLLDESLGDNGDARKNWFEHFHSMKPQAKNSHVDLLYGAKPGNIPQMRDSKSYVGRYFDDGYGELEITTEDGELILKYNLRTAPIKHLYDDVFKVDNLIADTTLYTLPLNFIADPATGNIGRVEIPFEPKTDPIVFNFSGNPRERV
jgi:hypothetical protein